MKRITFLLMCLLLSIGLVSAQSRVTGVVISAEDGGPVIGASVVVKGATGTGTVTDIAGNFTLNVPSGSTTLIVSYIGMITQEAPVSANMRIALHSDLQQLDEVVVVGYGTQRKADITSSITRVGGENIAGLASPSFDQQLAGRAAGVQVSQSTGELGKAPTIRVRGVNSLSSSTEPLYVVDGVPISTGTFGRGSAMADINPDDIESISVLKDGAATAIYGSRASNGVVLITTKKGKAGSATLSYSGYMSWATATKLPKLLNGQQFVDVLNEMYANQPSSAKPAVYDGTDTNWNDYMYRTGIQHSHTVAISGGTEKAQYYASGGYTDMEGTVIANYLKRFTVKADATIKATNWLRAGISFNGSSQKAQGMTDGWNSLSDPLFGGIRMLPNVAVYNPDDPTGYNIDKDNRRALGRGPNTQTIANNIPNQVWVLENNSNFTQNYRAIANAFLEIMPLQGLSLKSMVGADILLSDDHTVWMPEHGDGSGYGGYMGRTFDPNTRWNWQNILSYNVKINDHSLDLTGVQEYSKYSYRFFQMTGQNFSDKLFMDDFISGTFDMMGMFGGSQHWGMASYMFRANYNFANKYYLGASIRTDGLSKLPEDNRWGTFYGVSGAWRLSNESFWDGLRETINDFRLRGSFATVGNSGISGNYPYMGTYNPQKYGNQSGIYYNNVGNNNLKWETQQTLDLGFDMQLLNGRMSLEFAYWKKENSDIVLAVPIDPMLGMPGNKINQNIGQINNDGLEFTIGATIVNNRDLTWRVDLNVSTLRNEIIKLVDGDVMGTYTIHREGESQNTLWGYKYAGVNMENGNPMWYKKDGSIAQLNLPAATHSIYNPSNPADVSQSTSLTADDKVLLGNTIPKWFGGFNNTLTYKDFDLNLFFRFAGGYSIMNGTAQYHLNNLDFANKGAEVLDRWQSKEKPGNGIVPKLVIGRGNVTNREQETNGRFVEKGDYLKLGTVTLGYKLPRNTVSKAGITNARIYCTLQNVLTFTKYSGLDPELSRN
ncbi:MAG: TonB-dependent receptor, partial [Tannerella sp.]|nr:TonB-dependent receptor [Tannerella sp.]